MKYTVVFHGYYDEAYEVEADSEDEAIRLAEESDTIVWTDSFIDRSLGEDVEPSEPQQTGATS